MSSDRDALFRAICADDEDDTPRLAFADWLDENDDPARAEFVRAQVEFARLMDDGSDSQAVYEFLVDRDWVTRPAAKWEHIDAGIARRFELANRIEALKKKHRRAWVAELPTDCGVEWGDFRRGFIGGARLTDAALLASSAGRVRAAVPPGELVCHQGLSADAAARLADAGLLPWIRGLELHGDYAGGLSELARHAATSGIRTLTVRGSAWAYDNNLADALAGSSHWGGLRALDTRSLTIGPSATTELFRSPHLRGLTRLLMQGNGWTRDTMRPFVEAAFPTLTDLRFINAGLDDDAAQALANVPSLSSVRYFDLGHNRLTGRGATALLCSPHLTGMAFVGLEEMPVRGLDRQALKAAPAGGLRLFHCHGCRLTVGDVGALVRCPRLRDLWYLDLDDNGLAPGVVREIVRGFKKRCPPVVWLTMNRIDDGAAALLANWPAAEGLRVLELYQNPMGDSGVNALLNSPHMKNLDGLGVPLHVSEPVAASLRKRFKDHGLVQ